MGCSCFAAPAHLKNKGFPVPEHALAANGHSPASDLPASGVVSSSGWP
jgi:hypothetical protein